MASRSLIPSVIVLLASIAIYYQPAIVGRLAGQVDIDKTRLTRWANSTGLNNANCQRFDAADACEDVKIHHASNTAFLACGNTLERTHWYPCAGVRHLEQRAESSFREALFKHDIKTGQTVELKMEGLEGDFITHGMDIYKFPGDDTKIHIFAVNHARPGDTIVIFSHEIGTDQLHVVKNVKDPKIKTANGVAATGPLSFYFTNDHYFRDGSLRAMEEKFGPWGWASHVGFCDATNEEVSCRKVTATFPNFNGIALGSDRLFVGDSSNGTITIFDVKPDHSLVQVQQVDLGAAADNVKIVPNSGDPIVTVFPTLENLGYYVSNALRLGKDVLVPAAALRLDHEKDFAPELVYFDDGSILSFMTAAEIDPYNNVLVGGSVLQEGGFAVCKLPPGVVG